MKEFTHHCKATPKKLGPQEDEGRKKRRKAIVNKGRVPEWEQ